MSVALKSNKSYKCYHWKQNTHTHMHAPTITKRNGDFGGWGGDGVEGMMEGWGRGSNPQLKGEAIGRLTI